MTEAHHLTNKEVCERWHKLYKGTQLTQRYAKGEDLDEAQWQPEKAKLNKWRLDLANISRFMWALNEPIARMANAEDKCTERFYKTHPCVLPFGTTQKAIRSKMLQTFLVGKPL